MGYGGAPIAPSLVRSVKDSFPQATVFNGYGMTESASLMTVLPDQDAIEHADSVGYAVPSVDLGVIPFNEDRGCGRIGDARSQCDHRLLEPARGHLGHDRGRLVAHRRRGSGRRRGPGAHHRSIKDIINRGGENVSSVEVEAVLLAAPNVADACVLAVPDEVMGEKVGAVLFGEQDQIDVPAVLDHCRAQLADFKVPQYVTVVDSALPRNAGGKLLKGNLREQVQWGDPLR